jgi:hypothetical protein
MAGAFAYSAYDPVRVICHRWPRPVRTVPSESSGERRLPQTRSSCLGLMPCSAAAVPTGLRRDPRASLAARAPSRALAPASFPARPASALRASGDPVLCLAPECSFVLLMVGPPVYPPGIRGNRRPVRLGGRPGRVDDHEWGKGPAAGPLRTASRAAHHKCLKDVPAPG